MAKATDDLAESVQTSMADAAQDITHILSRELKTRFDSALQDLDKISHVLEAVPDRVSVSLKDYTHSATESLNAISSLLQTNADKSLVVFEGKAEVALAEMDKKTQSFHADIAEKVQSTAVVLTETIQSKMNATAGVIFQKLGVSSKELTVSIRHNLSRELESAVISSTAQLSDEVCKTIKDKMELTLKDFDTVAKL